MQWTAINLGYSAQWVALVEPLTRSDGAILQARNNADDRRACCRMIVCWNLSSWSLKRIWPLNGADGGCVVRAFNQHAFAELAAGSGATKTRYDFALAQGPGKALALRPGFKVIWL